MAMNFGSSIAFIFVSLGFLALLMLIPRVIVFITKDGGQKLERIPCEVTKGQLYLGSSPIMSLHEAIYLGGMLGYASGQMARVVEPGSTAQYFAYIGLVVALLVLFSPHLVKKSVTAAASPNPAIVITYRTALFPLVERVIKIQKPAWVRARMDPSRDLLVEVGTRAYETTDIVRIAHPFDRPTGIDESTRRAAALAALWNLENKGYVEFA